MIVLLLLSGLALFGWFGFLVLGGVSRGQKRAESNAEQILNEAFNGDPSVTFKINMQSVKYETVIVGAKERGYDLIHQADNQYGPYTLIFEKAADS